MQLHVSILKSEFPICLTLTDRFKNIFAVAAFATYVKD